MQAKLTAEAARQADGDTSKRIEALRALWAFRRMRLRG